MKAYRFRTLLLILFLCLAGLSGNAQTPSWNWVIPSNPEMRYMANMVTDQHGFIYAGGNINRVGFHLTKYQPNGTMIWSKVDSSTMVQQLSIDTAGNLYVTGISYMFAGSSLITAKLDSAGNRLWTKGIFANFGPNDAPTADLFAGAADSAGNTYMSGAFKSISNLTHFDTIALSNIAADNYFLAKYNSAGQIQWLRFYNDPVYAIAAGPQGSYFIENGLYFQKFAGNDTLIWQRSFSGTFNNSSPRSSWNKFKTDAQDNLYVLTAHGDKLAKFNSNGTLVWAKTTNFYGTDFSLTTAGNILVTGYFFGNATFGNGVPNLTSGTTDEALFVARFSGADGSANWAKSASTSGSNAGEAIVSLPNGNCLVAGNFDGGSTFDQIPVTGTGFFLAELSMNPLSLPKTAYNPNLQLYPNPASAEVTVAARELGNFRLQAYNLTGQLVYEATFEQEAKLNVQAWPAGIYVLKLTGKAGTVTKKLVVAH